VRSVVVTGALVVIGCREPTQVTLVLSTDVPCDAWQNATIAVGGGAGDVENAAPATKTTTCDPAGEIGTLVLVPRGSAGDAFTAKIVGGVHRAPETCVAPAYGAGCIVERRALRFLPHTSLRVLVALSHVCDGVGCTSDETCDPRSGACVSSALDPARCQGTGCDSVVLGPAGDAGAEVDSASALPDAALIDGAALVGDAGPGDPCATSALCASRCCCDYTPPSCDLKKDCGLTHTCLP
jgi:hypothetical protein